MLDSSVPVQDQAIETLLASNRGAVMRCVESAYQLFARGQAVEVAPSYLRPPHDARARIIAKPACLYGEQPIAGLKWIASFPANLEKGLPRASGVLILNDMETGAARAQMQVAAISAHRTAASAVLALRCLHGAPRTDEQISVIGCGVIAREIVAYLKHEGWGARDWLLFDLDVARAERFAQHLMATLPGARVKVASSAGQAASASPVVVFATSASVPSLMDWVLHPAQTVLHVSLRDLTPTLIESAANYVDSAELAFSHQTSLHLTEQQVAHRDYLRGEIGAVLNTPARANKPVIFSPFGMAILDLAVGQWVMCHVAQR